MLKMPKITKSNNAPMALAYVITASKALRRTAFLACTFLLLLIADILAPLYIDRNYSEALTGAPTLSETTLTLATSDINLAISNISPEGSFNTSNNTDNISVVTNNYTGYTLSISPESNETIARQLTITGNTTNVFNSISSATTAETYSASGSTGLNNTWGILPSKVDGVANTSYQPAPELEDPLVIEETTIANTTANNYSINMGARADYTNPVGTYAGTFIITATANEPRYTITYDANAGTDTVSNMPENQSSEAASSTSVVLSNNTPARTGYTFNGWNTAADGTGTDYAAGATYYLDQTTANDQTLYAKWTAKQYNLVITGDSNLSSLTIKQGSTTGTTITGTKSGNTVTFTNLTYGTSYYLYPVFNSGYDFSSWSKTDSATNSALGSISTMNTYYTMGDGDGALTLASKSSGYDLVVTGDANLSSMTLKQGSTSGTTVNGTKSGNTVTFTGLASGVNYYLYPVFKSGYTFNSWTKTDSASGSALGSTSTVNTYYTVGSGNGAVTLSSRGSSYSITLTNTNATTNGSTSATVTYGSSTISSISAPSRKYTLSGFSTSYNNASNATVSSTAAKTYTYSFNGWYTSTSSGTQVITSGGALTASNGFTNSSKQWTNDGGITLYAQWGNGTAITLPTISKAGYTCGWGTGTNTTSITYTSGKSGIVPTSNQTLYGVCNIKTNLSLKVSFDSGVSKVEVRSGSASGTLAGTVTTSGKSVSGLTYNTNYYLVPTYNSGKQFSSWSKDSGAVGSLSSTTAANPYYTIGDGTNAVTLSSKAAMYMQDYTKSTIASVLPNVGDTTTMYDNRDETPYVVGHAADGNYWMLQNLKLGARATGYTLRKTDSNTSGPFKLIGKLSDGKFTSSTNNGNSLTNDSSQFYCTTNYGCYYNWYTATAGSGTSATTSGDVGYSICPKGWTLPTSSQFTTLYNNYKSASLMLVNPTSSKDNTTGQIPGFLLGGYYYASGAGYVGSNGYYWSRTAASGRSGYYLHLRTSSVDPAEEFYKYHGQAVRCLAL